MKIVTEKFEVQKCVTYGSRLQVQYNEYICMMYCSVGKPVLRSRSRFFVGFLLLPSCPTDFFLFFKKCYISVLITKENSLSIKIVGHYFDK